MHSARELLPTHHPEPGRKIFLSPRVPTPSLQFFGVGIIIPKKRLDKHVKRFILLGKGHRLPK
jgi:hypothetical protein